MRWLRWEGMKEVRDELADVFSDGGKPTSPSGAEVAEIPAKIGTFAVERGFADGLKR